MTSSTVGTGVTGGQTGKDKSHLGNDCLQFLDGCVAVGGELAELFPRCHTSLSQLVSQLVSLSVQLVSGNCQILLHQLLLCPTGDQLLPQTKDGVLREEETRWRL